MFIWSKCIPLPKLMMHQIYDEIFVGTYMEFLLKQKNLIVDN